MQKLLISSKLSQLIILIFWISLYFELINCRGLFFKLYFAQVDVGVVLCNEIRIVSSRYADMYDDDRKLWVEIFDIVFRRFYMKVFRLLVVYFSIAHGAGSGFYMERNGSFGCESGYRIAAIGYL